MNRRRTRAWWIVRFELAVGIALALLAARLGMETAMTMCGCNPPTHSLPLPPTAALALVASAIAVTGVGWMTSIMRGHSDDPPRWRYRDG